MTSIRPIVSWRRSGELATPIRRSSTWRRRGNALAEFGKWDDALPNFDRALARNPIRRTTEAWPNRIWPDVSSCHFAGVRKITQQRAESVRFQCRVAGKILRSSRPPQNRTCEFPRIRLKHLPAYRGSAALVSVLDCTSGGRELGQCRRWRGPDAPGPWCCRADQGRHRTPPCRPRTAILLFVTEVDPAG
jgi:hypothetical protein